MTAAHVPVLLDEVVHALAPKNGEIHVDATFGAGGYTGALLQAASCRVVAVDRDPDAIARANALAAQVGERLSVVQGRFGDLARLLGEAGIGKVDGMAFDIGVSSMQIDQEGRGFSFAKDGPLDMRMEQAGRSAADLVNTLPEAELATIIFKFGEERHARRVARAIALARTEAPITTTSGLAQVVRRAVPKSQDGIDPATRTFQALRIAVNDELGELERGLAAAETLLAPGGRLAVVTFHSLEDRLVKDFLRVRSGNVARPSRHVPANDAGPAPTFTLLSKKPIAPTAAEIARNSRARSAKLRAATRTEATAWPQLSHGCAP